MNNKKDHLLIAAELIDSGEIQCSCDAITEVDKWDSTGVHLRGAYRNFYDQHDFEWPGLPILCSDERRLHDPYKEHRVMLILWFRELLSEGIHND